MADDVIPEPTYAQYSALRPLRLRDMARAVALTTLATATRFTGRMQRLLSRPRVQFIYLHHVLSDEEPSFRQLLKDLSRQHTFIGHSEGIRRVQSGEIDRPYVSFSFDDGFRDNMRAARVLEEFGTTGCFFVCPALVGEQSRDKLAAFARHLEFPVITPLLSWQDMEQMVAAGHEIGGHTMTHPALSAVPANQLQEEIGRSREEILRRLGKAAHFAWPRGRWVDFSPAARKAVFDAGFVSCASAVRGCHVTAAGPSPTELCIRRDHIIANWPLQHVLYLLAKNAQNASETDNRWPAEYRQAA